MARLPVRECGDELTRIVYNWCERFFGTTPNFVKTLSYSPVVTAMLVPFVVTLQTGIGITKVDKRLKELVALAVSRVNQCKYCATHNEQLGRQAGVSEEQLQALTRGDFDSDLFTDRERVALRWVELVTRNTAKYDATSFKWLVNHFDFQEIVEITLIAGMFNMINRFNDSLWVDLEEDGSLPSSKSADLNSVREYLEHLASSLRHYRGDLSHTPR